MPFYGDSSSARYRQKNYDNSVVAPKPEIMGYYSVDKDRSYLPDSSNLLYFHPPEDDIVALDLDEGRDQAVRRVESFLGEGIKLLLQWVQDNRDKVKAAPETDRLIGPNFVCSGNTLMKFLSAPYTPNDSWTMWAAKWKGTIYLRSKKSMVGNYTMDEELNKKFTSWGHKFEQYIMSESPDEASDTTKPVIEPREFRCVYRIRFADHWVLFSTVMKGVCSKERLKDPLPLDELKFIDLKTSRMIEHAGHERTLKRHKFLKWWIKGMLTNTEKVLCGFRDDNGIVNKLTTFEMDKMVKVSRSYWDPQECIKCCDTLFSKLAKSVINECDETIYEFNRVSHEDFNITELEPSEENLVIPHSYMDAMG